MFDKVIVAFIIYNLAERFLKNVVGQCFEKRYVGEYIAMGSLMAARLGGVCNYLLKCCSRLLFWGGIWYEEHLSLCKSLQLEYLI